MTRRPLVLAILILAACTADLPTEPGPPSGPGPSAALPPVPAPPTQLSATLPAADGAPVLAQLGFYEAPTLARVTVSGILHYSGMEMGYYAGSGAFDYQGRWIPGIGRCASILTVYIQNVGSIGGAMGSCPATWQTVGSITTLAVVSGQIMVGRAAPAPGACFYGESPCAAISGEQSVSVEPINGELRITVDRDSTYPGGLIAAKFSADPEAVDGKGMPWSLRQVTFEGHGDTLGGGTPTACTTWSRPTECSFRLYQSGWLVAEGLVSGKLRTTRQWLHVQGGDSLPPPPPVDTMPTDTLPTDTIPTDTIPSDTMPGDGGCSSASSTSGSAGGCDSIKVALPSLACSPSTVTRADDVHCLTLVSPASNYVVDSATIVAGPNTLRQVVGAPVAAGDTFRLSGPALLSSVVTVWVTVDSGGTAVTRGASSSFAVAPRTWTELDRVWPAPRLNRYQMDPSPSKVDRAPRRTRTGDWALLAGIFKEVFPDWAGLIPAITTARAGPNKGLVYVASPVVFAGVPQIYTSPWLADSAFLRDQNGGAGSGMSRCTLSQFLGPFQGEIERHEGATQSVNSHWGKYPAALQTLALNQYAEGLVLTDQATNDPLDSLNTKYEMWRIRTMIPLQARFDTLDYPLIAPNAGCEIDLDLGDR